MDFSESTKIVFNRIQKLEPENVTKIIGYLLLQDHGDQEMIGLAGAPDNLIHEVIYKAKLELQQLASKPMLSPISPSMNAAPVSQLSLQSTPFSPVSSKPFWSPETLQYPSPQWNSHPIKKNLDFLPKDYSDSVSQFQDPNPLLTFEGQMKLSNSRNFLFLDDYYLLDSELQNLSARTGRKVSGLPEFPAKICHYFNKGFCKHGTNCRYLHEQVIPESLSQMFRDDVVNEDHVFSPQSLEQLEMEIIELIRSRRGNPVSIASLPMIYYEKYGKVLQAEGYLTESQRHGKAGYSLTKLLARLKNSIQLIDRPHGQHAVILAEDAPKYMENRTERNDPGPIVSGSRQIYLTFPAESTFTEDDVSNYFNNFGPVEDVRIPCQQKRMFGFVTFVSADTVKIILAKGNPHFVCGARVLVKPYREKPKFFDRKYSDRIEPPVYYSPHYMDMDSEFHSMPRGCEGSRLLRKQLMEDQEQALELETRRLAEFKLVQKPLASQPNIGYSMDGLKVSEGHFDFPSAERFNHLLDVLNNGSTSDKKLRHADINYTDYESQGFDLPESPFVLL